ncbi:TRAP transporter small permease [Calorimonas adulescens]|uniref:TRAP transporter small permease n=1 Tax=Calorimonas adulescens TaxID=2606906 RepID=A0A5D8QF13_9THEO|nr:TRAP transporter small permease [Calorimonas adulescens]TZE82774.1 TRAP transporter small permease [Calorimonas adulescens]
MKLFEKSLKVIIKGLNYICALLLGLMAVIVFINVIERFILSSSIPWAEEVARFLLIWVVFIGAVINFYYDEHLGLDILTARLHGNLKKFISLIAYLVITFILILVIYYGYQFSALSLDWPAPASKIPFGYVYMIAPISCMIMLIVLIYKLIKLWVKGGE